MLCTMLYTQHFSLYILPEYIWILFALVLLYEYIWIVSVSLYAPARRTVKLSHAVLQVDPHLGGDEALISLSKKLHSENMYLLLDAVLNHTSVHHVWFDKYKGTCSGVDNEKHCCN